MALPQRGSRQVWMSVVGLCAVCVLLVLVLTRQPAANATNDALQRHVMSISEELHAPGDTNSLTVATSNLPIAQHMRYQIQQYLLQGKSDRQILAMMEQTYGHNVLSTPRFRGFGSFVWLAPVVVVFAAFLLAFYYVRRRTRKRSGSLNPAQDHGDQAIPQSELESRLREYL